MKPRAVFAAAVLLALLAAPLAAQAQQAGKVYRVGFLAPSFAAFPLEGVAAPRSTSCGRRPSGS
jgi:hypothetical protein